MPHDTLKDQVLQLPAEERAQLALDLLNSLDAEDGPEVEALWAEEAERRYQAYRSGQMQGIDADQALRQARSRLP